MNTVFDTECALKGKRRGGRLELWYVHFDGRFVGSIYDDESWRNGQFLHTSKIRNHYVDENVIETQTSFYTLGKPASSVSKDSAVDFPGMTV